MNNPTFLAFQITAFFCCFCVSAPAFAQQSCAEYCSCSVSGSVVDVSTNEPVPYASIKIKGTATGTLTNGGGYFTIPKLCLTEFDLEISHVGYKSLIHHHDVYHPGLIVKMAPKDVILESVVVEGSTTATGFKSFTEAKIAGKELEALKNESLGDILTNISGISTLKTGPNVVKPIIHGLHSNRVLIINNGVRHESQNWGSEHAPEIDPSLADNIRLVKGAATVKYGPDALGGVIVIDPPKMELSTEHLHGEVGLIAETNGRSVSTDILLQRGYKKFAWMGQISGLYQGDMKTPDYYLTNTGARELSYSLGTRYHQGNYDLAVYFSHVEQQLGILRGSVVGNIDDLDKALKSSSPFYTKEFSYEINNPNQDISHDLLRVKGTYNFEQSQLDLQYGYQINKRKEYDVRRGNNNERPAIDLELYTHSLDIDWQHTLFSGWSGTLGGQWLYQDNNNLPGTNTIPFVPNYNNSRIGIYLIESKALGKIDLETGIRFDRQNSAVRGRGISNDIYRNSFVYQSLTGLVGADFHLGKKSKLQSNFGTAWRSPNIAELYSFGKHEFTIDYGLWRYDKDEFGNINSSEEVYNQETRPVKQELGFKWVNTYTYTVVNHSLEITGYINFIKNYIYSSPAGITTTVRGPFPYYIYNQTNALFMGGDVSYLLTHNHRWGSQLKASYIIARDAENNDSFIGIPANRLRYTLTFNNDIFEAKLGAAYHFKRRDYPRVITVAEIRNANGEELNIFQEDASNFDFVPAPNGYLLVNAAMHTTINKFVFGLQLKNLLNARYRSPTNRLRYFADEPGINLSLSVRYKF